MSLTRSFMLTAMTLALAAALPMAGATAQQEKSIKDQLVGTWSLVSLVAVQGDKKFDVFGANPRGKMILSPDGHFSTLTVRAELPKFASNNRMQGTPEEYKAIVQGSQAHYGTWSIDEANKTITFSVEVATFPNWDGEAHNRIFTLNGDELSYVNPVSAVGGTVTELRWKRAN